MNSEDKTARIVGFLFVGVLVAFFTGLFILDPILTTDDYLLEISKNETTVTLGAFFELLNGVFYVSITILLYPVMKRYDERYAIGYVVFRLIEFVCQLISDISPLVLIGVSKEYINAGSPPNSHYQVVGDILISIRNWSYEIQGIGFGLSALLFFYFLYQSKLVPRFISIWGLLAAVLVLTNTLFVFIALGINLGIIAGLPMLTNELFLGFWLIIKGFNSSIIISDTSVDES